VFAWHVCTLGVTLVGPVLRSSSSYIGRKASGSFLSGWIEDFWTYGRALSSDEVKILVGGDILVASYIFDGSLLTDTSGNALG
jgi:hypothetical protein